MSIYIFKQNLFIYYKYIKIIILSIKVPLDSHQRRHVCTNNFCKHKLYFLCFLNLTIFCFIMSNSKNYTDIPN